MQPFCSQTGQFHRDTDSMSSDNLLCLIRNKYSVHVGIRAYHHTHSHTHTIRLRAEAAESTRMFVCIEGLVKLNGRGGALFLLLVEGWLVGCWRRESMLGWPQAINRRLSRPSAASLIYGAPPIAPGFIWPLSNTCSVRERSPTLAGPLCILNNPDGNCPFLKC